MTGREAQRGFTVVETLLATVLLVALGFGTLAAFEEFRACCRQPRVCFGR